MRPLISLAVLAGVVLLPAQSSGRTWHIQVDGSGDSPTVQAGIDSAAAGDTILVAPGRYIENINFLGKDVAVISDMGPEATTLDGSGQVETVVLFENHESRAAVLEGFTITGGRGHVPEVAARIGGGVFINGSSPTVRGNHIIDNEASSVGGGIGYERGGLIGINPLIEGNLIEKNDANINGGGISVRGDATIRRNVLRGNRGIDGGGIWIWINHTAPVSPVVEENEFWENVAGDHGAGIHSWGPQTVTIRNNLFVRNRAGGLGGGDTGSGGAMYISALRGQVTNNTVVDNFGDGETPCSGGGLTLYATPPDLLVMNNIFAFNEECGVTCKGNADATFGPNLFWENIRGDMGNGAGVCPSEWSGNAIITDPYFCDPENGNYTLAANSPALGAPEPFGAFTTPGCGPVAVVPITWGRIKAMYGN